MLPHASVTVCHGHLLVASHYDYLVDILERARKMTREILSSHYPRHIGDDLDSDLRQRFPVKLQRELMSPGNPRWS